MSNDYDYAKITNEERERIRRTYPITVELDNGKLISKTYDIWRDDSKQKDKAEIAELQKHIQQLFQYMRIMPGKEVEEDKEAKELASLIRFMTMCFNRTTDFAKCDLCEFRFKCFTEVAARKEKKDVSNNKKRKRKTIKKKMSPFNPGGGVILRPKDFDRRIIKSSK